MSDFTLGKHEQAIEQLLLAQQQMQADIAEIKKILAERAGERRMILWLVSVSGAVVGAVCTLIFKVVGTILKVHAA